MEQQLNMKFIGKLLLLQIDIFIMKINKMLDYLLIIIQRNTNCNTTRIILLFKFYNWHQ